jgi:twitching motility two-component system response regulator PilG
LGAIAHSPPETPIVPREWELKPVTQVPRIVCIDDDLAIGKTVEYTLQAKGYRITAIQNPVEALTLVFQLKPDLILCDLAMPELDGYEICGMLRKSTAFRQTPIIMLTGKGRLYRPSKSQDGWFNRLFNQTIWGK